MNTRYAIFWLITIALSAQTTWSTPTLVTHEIVEANNVFALDLYAQVAKGSGNIVLSPFSIDIALAMTYAGARVDTARQMAGVLHLPDKGKNVHACYKTLLKALNETNMPDCQLLVANALWTQEEYPIVESFDKFLRDQYGARLSHFEAVSSDPTKAAAVRKQINNWVASQTHGKIGDIICPPLPSDVTRLILINAIYFKGLWSTPFNKALTKNAPFHTDSDASVSVSTMHTDGSFKYAEDDSLQMLELPYSSGQLSMVVLLPRKSDGLSELEKTLTTSRLEQLHQTSYRQEVTVSLPKFKQTSEFNLVDPLKAMGMRDAFDGDDADFSGITMVRPFFIEAAIHKAFVDVNEDGTEAAASTVVALANDGMDLNPIVFEADHPFLFIIRHNATGTILLMGKVVNPLQ